MKAFFIRCVTAIIPGKNRRRHMRNLLEDHSPIREAGGFIRFFIRKARPKSVLLVEANSSHGEQLPGISRYFLDLGYNIDIVMTVAIADEKPLCRMHGKNIRSFSVSYKALPFILSSAKTRQYDFIIICTSADYNSSEDGKINSLIQNLGFTPSGKYGSFIMEHETGDITRFNELGFIDEKRLFTLLPFQHNGKTTQQLNPHYFGDIEITGKNPETVFLSIGEIEDTRKNFSLLPAAVSSLLEKGSSNFKVIIVGKDRRKLIKTFPESLRQHIIFKGRLPFPRMYEEMENADFLLALLDSETREHMRYITSGVSGSLQLSLGFRKPCLIDSRFASFYRLEPPASLVYEVGRLAKAMQEAITMPEAVYRGMQLALEKTAARYYDASLKDISESIESTIRRCS